jgi:hypothetical protein
MKAISDEFAQTSKAFGARLLGTFVFIHEGIGAADLLLKFIRAGDIHNAQADREFIAAAGILIGFADELQQTFADQQAACFSAV